MFNIIKLKAENKQLREELEQKEQIIQYLNSIANKANRRAIYARQEAEALRAVLRSQVSYLDFPNSEVEGQMSISDVLEN